MLDVITIKISKEISRSLGPNLVVKWKVTKFLAGLFLPQCIKLLFLAVVIYFGHRYRNDPGYKNVIVFLRLLRSNLNVFRESKNIYSKVIFRHFIVVLSLCRNNNRPWSYRNYLWREKWRLWFINSCFVIKVILITSQSYRIYVTQIAIMVSKIPFVT